MAHLILNADGTPDREINTTANIEWDATHCCPPDKLTAEEAEYFRVYPLVIPDKPAYDNITTSCNRGGYKYIKNQWMVVWKITPLSAEEIASNQKRAIQSQITALESTVTERRRREAILGIDNGWLANLNAQIDALRATL